MSRSHAGSGFLATCETVEMFQRQLNRATRDVRMDQGTACDRGHLVDGWHALSAAAVRLPLRSRDRLETVRDVQGDGTPAFEGDHQSGDDRHLAGRALPCLERALVRLGLAVRQ